MWAEKNASLHITYSSLLSNFNKR